MPEISFNEIKMEKQPFASGGFGKVYKAKWRKESIAIKVIKAGSEEEKQAVKCEANLTLSLIHPNVIKLYGITRVKGMSKHGIVMEEAEHGSLDMWIGKIDRGKLTKIALGIVDGLIYVHSQHVIHRDIKPQNILMFGPEGDMIPKIADFGVSKVIETTIKTRTKVGHEIYMAPEVKMFAPYGLPADIFSLAMTLFEMFNKQLISESSDEMRQFVFMVHGGKIGEIPKSCKVPVYLLLMIKRGWAYNPDNRPTLSEYYSVLRG